MTMPSELFGQGFTIDPADEQIDPNWENQNAIIRDQVGYGNALGEAGLLGDIVSAWIVFVPDDPQLTYNPDRIYFRIDGYAIEDDITIKFDCDGDTFFTSEVDRAITFEAIYDNTSDSLGSIDGIVNYTPEYIDNSDEDPDLLSSETVQGEFVETYDNEADTEFIQIEAIYDLSGRNKFDGDLSTCFGEATPNIRQVNYQYDTGNDSTQIKSKEIVTAVTLSQQSAEAQESLPIFTIIWTVLGAMTFSLLILRRKNNQSTL